MCYLDNSATTKPSEAAVKAVVNAMTINYGNPSSLYRLGIDAENEITQARRIIAQAIGCEAQSLYFTSCATESSNTVIFGAAENYGKRKKKVVTTAIEHPSVSVPFEKLEKMGFEVVRIFPDKEGKISADMICDAVDENTFLVSCMLVNNETGYILPVSQAFGRIKKRFPDCITHCDGVQAFMKMRLNVKKLNADCLSLSAHKVHGPKGIGALYVKKGVRIAPYLMGGGQERNFRSGTEAVPLIAGFGAAVKELDLTVDERYKKICGLKNYLAEKISGCEGVRLNSGDDCLPYVNSITVFNIKAETLLHYLESKGVYVSSGSACSKGKKSEVLKAFGFSDAALDSTVRVSFSAENEKSDIDTLIREINNAKNELCKIRQKG